MVRYYYGLKPRFYSSICPLICRLGEKGCLCGLLCSSRFSLFFLCPPRFLGWKADEGRGRWHFTACGQKFSFLFFCCGQHHNIITYLSFYLFFFIVFLSVIKQFTYGITFRVVFSVQIIYLFCLSNEGGGSWRMSELFCWRVEIYSKAPQHDRKWKWNKVEIKMSTKGTEMQKCEGEPWTGSESDRSKWV